MDTEINTIEEKEVDLAALLTTLWEGKKFILLITSLFSIGTLIYVLLIPNEYESHIILAPTSEDSNSVIGGMASQLGGLASIAGVSIGEGSSSQAQKAMTIMQSWAFVENYIVENDLSKLLVAVKSWDNRGLHYYENIFNSSKETWVEGKAPTSWELFKVFSKKVNVSEDKKTALVTISFEHYSPIVAKSIAETYVASINEYMRQRRIQQSKDNVAYLQDEVTKTSNSNMKIIFYNIIEDQIKNMMLAEATPEYVFKTVSKAMVPEEKSKPVRSQILIAFTLLGFIVALLLVYILHYNGFKFNKVIPSRTA